MSTIFKLSIREFIIQNKIHNLLIHILTFLLFSLVLSVLVHSLDEISKYVSTTILILFPLSIISAGANVIKCDFEDGSLETLLTTFNSIAVIFAKYINLCFCTIVAIFISNIFVYFVFNYDIIHIANIILCMFAIQAVTCALMVLSCVIKSYFRIHANFISVLILPILIPFVMIGGIILSDQGNRSDLYIFMFGIILFIIPIILYSASYLLKTIFNPY